MPAVVDTSEFETRLASIARVFDLGSLAGRGLSEAEIGRYYEKSALGYRFFHSSDGAMHMALNPDGAFDPDGYYGQAREVERGLADARDVLELACGNGFNLRYLAERHPNVRFTGIDLVAKQIETAASKLKELPNADVAVGNFQELALTDGRFEVAFVVESLCHATDLPRALAETRRVLRPGGTFVVIDAWRTEAYATLPDVVKRAATVTEQAMSVGRPWVLGDWLAAVDAAGFEVVDDRDLSAQIMPNLRRFERMASEYLSHPTLARLSLHVVPPELVTNAIAGYLMPLTVGAGAHTYRIIVLRRC